MSKPNICIAGIVREMTSDEFSQYQADQISSQSLLNSVIPDITARQLRLWLIANGIALSNVDSAISSIPDTIEKAKAQIEWEYATAYKRDHPLVAQITTAIGMTSVQVDEAFRDASKL